LIDFARHDFHWVVQLPEDYDVLDLSVAPELRPPRTSKVAIGRYDEVRPSVYDQPLFGGDRILHVGIDLGGEPGSPVHAFASGRIHRLGVNEAQGDYGPTIVTVHELDGRELFALHGHLSGDSLAGWSQGQSFGRGDRLGWIGQEAENGGWPPHLHFQLSWVRPDTHDLPGVVRLEDRPQALRDYPDPRHVLGPLY